MAKKTKKVARPRKVKEFTLFSKLPLELRLMIVELSLVDPKIVTVRYRTINDGNAKSAKHGLVAAYAIPPMLHVSQESRFIALKAFDAAFASRLGGVPVYFDFAKDCLLFEDKKTVIEFYGSDNFHAALSGPQPCSLEKELLVWAFGKDCVHFNLTPRFLNFLGKPKHICFVSQTGSVRWQRWMANDIPLYFEDARNKGLDSVKSYEEPTATCKTLHQLKVMLVGIREIVVPSAC